MPNYKNEGYFGKSGEGMAVYYYIPVSIKKNDYVTKYIIVIYPERLISTIKN